MIHIHEWVPSKRNDYGDPVEFVCDVCGMWWGWTGKEWGLLSREVQTNEPFVLRHSNYLSHTRGGTDE